MINQSLCDLVLTAMTVMMEAEGEDYEGKLAVAWTIKNRSAGGRSPIGVILRPYQFSCWSSDSPTRKRIGDSIAANTGAWQESVKAATSAFLAIERDPTDGATHYLNLAWAHPVWYDPAKVTVVIGKHTFLKGV